MNYFLKQLAFFSIFSLVGYCLILVLWSKVIPFDAFKKNMDYNKGSYGHMYSRMKEVNTVKNIDILFIGSSHAYRGFDPRIFASAGYSSFNLGSSNQTPIQSLSLLRSNIGQLNPKLVIYEVFPGIFQNDGVESSLDIVANAELDWETVKMAFKVNHLKTYNTLIYDSFLELLNLNTGFQEPTKKGYDSYVFGGYVEKDNSFLRKQDEPGLSSWIPLDKQWKTLLQIKEMLSKKGIKLLLVRSPVDARYYNRLKNQKEINDRFKSVGDYINFNDFIKFKYKEDLYDWHHLYQSGVEKFNLELIQILKKQNYIE